MPSAAAWWPWVASVAAAAIVGAYAAPWLHYLCKPAATLLIAAMVLRLGAAAEPGYRRAIVAGLLLSTAGDVFLMLPGDWFVFGLASFLCAHVAYLVGLCRRARPFAAAWPFLAYAALAGSVLYVLWPHLPGELRIPVIVYVAVLAAMAAQAAAVWRARADRAGAAAALGGACFVLSDATLAIDRFAAPFAAAQALVLVSYWAAQWWIGRSATLARS
ncbi:lysoplasmalogenase [Lysobacter firmicutimachus]|uniref:Lysoplasmalogenase n=1 Tax=Lysobacter firmicutimachus TaxID=1792846 RepID=A0AAU8MN39_9GAMM